MSPATQPRSVVHRFAQLAMFAACIFVAEQLFLLKFQPDQAASFAVEQLRPDNSAAQALRLYTTTTYIATTLSVGLAFIVGLTLFRPELQRLMTWLRQCRLLTRSKVKTDA